MNDVTTRALRSRATIILLACAVLFVVLAVVDRALSRPDRIRLARQQERMTDLRDAIMRFQVDNKRAPATLDEVVGSYAPEEMTQFVPDARVEDKAPLTYDADKGELALSQPFVVSGVVSRERAVAVEVPQLRPEASAGAPPAEDIERFGRRDVAGVEDDIVFEAEHFTSLTYGWEIFRHESASGGCYILMKEGVGDFESERKIAADPTVRSGDFYNVTRDRRRIEARHAFELERPGQYYIYARTMSARSKCSNCAYLTIDGRQYTAGHNGSVPFVWLWHAVGSVYLRPGAHALSLMAHQDGVKIDSVVLSRTRRSTWRNFGKAIEGRAPRTPSSIAPLNLSVSTNSIALTDGTRSEVDLYIHSNLAAERDVTVTAKLASSSSGVWHDQCRLHVGARDELVRLRIHPHLPEKLERREYVLTCTLASASTDIETRTVAFVRAFDWSVLGPFPYIHAYDRGPVEDNDLPEATYTIRGRAASWKRFDPRNVDHFGMLDFGKMYTGRTFHALSASTLYAYTEFDAPGGSYILKAQGDDDVVVWLNGRRALAITEKGPPIRTARERPLQLKGGRYRLLIRLNQIEDQWMAGVRLRTADDGVADVVGVPFDEQNAPPKD